MGITTLVFFAFAAVLIASAVMVVSARNPVHSVLFLILAFFNAAGLFLLIGAEYLAMTLVIVYVGAVAVLFLFVIMMLDINIVTLRQGFMRHMPLGASVAVVFFAELLMMCVTPLKHATPSVGGDLVSNVPNTQAIGMVLYTDYIYVFQIAGLILLVAMIGAIVLTLRDRPGVRRQSTAKQNARKRSETIELVKVQSGQGA